MKIITKCGGRYKKDAKARSLIELYAKRTRKTMTLLSEKLKFKLPKQITVRPLYSKSDLCYIGNPFFLLGRAIWTPDNGFEIAIEIQNCMNTKDSGLAVVDHECIHIANVIKYDDWGHGHLFEMTKKEVTDARKRTASLAIKCACACHDEEAPEHRIKAGAESRIHYSRGCDKFIQGKTSLKN